MLDVLAEVEAELPVLLQSSESWASLNINYHPPMVERVHRRWREYRVYLHRIHPCQPGEALFHPHPWPSAMRILSGVYEMGVGYGAGNSTPPQAARIISAGDMRYEMTDPDAWHYVRPVDAVAMTLMVTGPPWDRWSPGSRENLQPLANDAVEEILTSFRQFYPTLPC